MRGWRWVGVGRGERGLPLLAFEEDVSVSERVQCFGSVFGVACLNAITSERCYRIVPLSGFSAAQAEVGGGAADGLSEK